MQADVVELENSEMVDFPENWSKKTIEEIAIINRENANPIKEFPEEEFTYIDISNVESGGTGQIVNPKKIIGKEAPSRAKRVIQKDDVILSTVRPYLQSYTIVPQEYDGEICSTGYAVLTAKDKMDPHFLLYSCLTTDVQEQFKRMMRGANYPALNLGHVKQTTVPYPPFTEQRKIASILTTVRNAIEQTEAVIQATRELKKSMMKHLFTYGPVPVNQTDQVELEETDIGLMPESWSLQTLGEIANFRNGINFKSEQKGDTGILAIDVLNMFTDSIYPSTKELYRVDKQVKDDYLLKDGDLLFVRSSLKQEGVGWTTVYEDNLSEEPITYVGFIIRARLNKSKGINPKFLAYYFRSSIGRENLIKSSGKVAITNINQGMLGDNIVPLPDPDTQEKIVNKMDLLNQKIRREIDKKMALEKLFDSLLKNLMTAKVRVV